MPRRCPAALNVRSTQVVITSVMKEEARARKFTDDDSNEGIIKALQETNYGRCVFQLDNNVVDHQVVNMEFEDGATATFSMCGFTRDTNRTVQIMGTKGEIRGNMVGK